MEINHLEEIKKFFAEDQFATGNGAVVDAVDTHYAKCSLALQRHHRNAMGAVMGGATFMLADFAFAVASNWQRAGTVSVSSSITYLGTAKGTRLIAEANCVKDGRTMCCYQVDVKDDLDNPVAAVLITGYHKDA